MIISKFVIDKSIINNEIKVLNNLLSQQRQLKKILLSHLEKISEGIYNAIDLEDENSLISCLDGIKKSFENIKENINNIIDLKIYLENITTFDAFDTSYLEKYNEKFLDLFDKISEDNIFYYSFMESLLKYMKVLFPEKILETPNIDNQIEQIIENNISQNTNSITNDDLNEFTEAVQEQPSDEENMQEIMENTLLICNKSEIAILPYSVIELEKCFSNNPEKYSSLQDIINTEYTVSLNQYKNVAFSRFREAFNLAKNKCNLSLIDSLNLANELFLNTNLNPVVITACKNIDELDIYLSCLENNVLEDFKCFNILYK